MKKSSTETNGRTSWLRQHFKPPAMPSGYVVKVAETRREFEQAYRLVHDQYVECGYIPKSESGIFSSFYQALPSTVTIVGEFNGEIIATVTLVGSNRLGLPIERIFQLTKTNSAGTRLAEVSGFAIKPGHRHNQMVLALPMFKLLYDYAQEIMGVDSLVTMANPRNFEVFESLFFLKKIGYSTPSGLTSIGSGRVIAGYLNMRSAYRRLKRCYSDGKESLFSYFAGRGPDGIVFPDFDSNPAQPKMRPEDLDYFFNQKTNLFAMLPELQRCILRHAYLGSTHVDVLPETSLTALPDSQRKSQRLEIERPGLISFGQGRRMVELSVLDVSESGLKAKLASRIRFGDLIEINVNIGGQKIVQVKGWPVWQNGQTYGFRLAKVSGQWRAYVKQLSGQVLQAA